MKIAEFLCLAKVLPVEISFKFQGWDELTKMIVENECPETEKTFKLTDSIVNALIGTLKLLPWEKLVKISFMYSLPGRDTLFITSLTIALLSGRYSKAEFEFLQRLFREDTIIIEGKEFSFKKLLSLSKVERLKEFREKGLPLLKAELANLLFSVT
jgi:hypothetical protein